MNSYFFKYDFEKELVVTDINDNIIASGNSVYNVFDLMTNELIKDIYVNGKDITINYDSSSVIFKNYPMINLDSRYSFIKDYISSFASSSLNVNIKQAKKIVEEKKRKVENTIVKPKKKHSFLKRVSVTGVIVTTSVLLALGANEYYKVDTEYNHPVREYVSSSTSNRGNDFVADRYSLLTKKYSKKFGIDSELVLAVLTNNIENTSQYVDKDHYGAIISEFDSYVGQELSYYDFETENWSNYRVTEDDMLDSDKLVRVIFMILQAKIYFCNYNVVAGIQCMHENIYDFKERVMADGREKHPEYTEKSFFEKEYFNFAMSYTSDISWIENFKSPDGSIYAIKVLKHIPSGTSLLIKHPDGEITNYILNINYSTGKVLK